MFSCNTAGQFIHFQGVDATTGGIKSGVTWTVRRCIDGTFADGGGTVTEDGTTGWYKFAMSQADTNGNNIGFNFTGTGAVPQTVNILTDGTQLNEGYPTLGGTGTFPQLLYAILQHLEEASISGTTKTVKKRDQVTTAETLTLDSATAPTSITRAT